MIWRGEQMFNMSETKINIVLGIVNENEVIVSYTQEISSLQSVALAHVNVGKTISLFRICNKKQS